MKKALKAKGQPTKRTPETLRLILQAAEVGAPLRACCAVAGISTELLRLWCDESPDIAGQITQARERGRVSALHTLQQAGQEDWRACAEWLRLSFREDYSARAEIKIEQEGQGGPIIVTEEVLKSLQSGYRELIEGIQSVE